MTTRHSFQKRRKGMALVVVMVLLAIAMAGSYAMLRTQSTNAQVQQNFNLIGDSRAAAEAGLAIAIQKMHQADWAGADSGFSQNLDAQQWFEVSYSTGDASLTASSADYAEYPYRVTVVCTGYAANLDFPSARSVHKLQAVMQLVRRKLSAPPAGFNTVSPYNVYQWANQTAVIQSPVQIDGAAYFRGDLAICAQPNDSSARSSFLSGLNTMRILGYGDHRPLTGTVALPYSSTSSGVFSDLSNLGVTTNNVFNSSSAPLSQPGSFSGYQLYPGGKTYSVTVLPNSDELVAENVTYSPDQKTNPLGIVRTSGKVKLHGNVNFTGCLLIDGNQGDLVVKGTNIHLTGVTLPPLDGATASIRLPAAILSDDFQLEGAATGSLTGIVCAADEFEFGSGSNAAQFVVQGKVIAAKILLRGRTEWPSWQSTWDTWEAQYWTQWLFGTKIFPLWLYLSKSLPIEPLLTIRPESSGVSHHWPDWTQPIFVKHADDAGLRWDLIRREEVE